MSYVKICERKMSIQGGAGGKNRPKFGLHGFGWPLRYFHYTVNNPRQPIGTF